MFYSREWFCACFRSINQIDLGNQEVLMIAEGEMNFQLQYNLLVSVKWKNGVSKQKASLTIISVLPVYFILPQTNHWTLWIIAVISLAGGFCVSWPFTWWVEKGFTYVCTVCQVWGWKRKKKKHYHCTKCRYCDVTAMTGHWNMENQNALSPTRIQLKHSSCLSSLDCFNV